MTIDLARTLHDAVDDAGTAHPLGYARPGQDAVGETVGHLATRIRTRRAVRAGTRAGVGLVAVGAIAAFGGQLVGRRGADDLLPAAVPGAAPGTCGSSVADLVATSGTDLTVDLTRIEAFDESGARAADAGVLGPLVGRDLAATVKAALVPGSSAGLPGVTVTGDVTSYSTVIRSSVVVVHEGTVVAASAPMSGAESLLQVLTYSPTAVMAQVTARLVTCATSRDPGGVALPADSYELYPVVEYPDPTATGGIGRAVGNPTAVTLLPEVPLLASLPEGFPADVPIIGGRLIEAQQLDGTTASGWTVTVAVDGVDGLTRAIDALGRWPESTGFWQIDIPTRDGRWQVKITTGLTDDGDATVVYLISPS